MSNNFLFPILYICILGIGIDLALYFFRRKKYESGSSLFFGMHSIFKRIAAWLAALPAEGRSNAKNAADESTPATVQLSKVVSAGGKGKPIHVEISADIPEGTTLQFNLKIVDAKGKTTTRKGSLAHEAEPASKSVKSRVLKGKAPSKPSNKKNGPRQVLMPSPQRNGVPAILGRIFQSQNAGWILLAAGIAVYAIVISFGIDRFPIYFFTDEAIHMNMAADFLRDHFQNYDHEFLPTFFIAEGWVNGTSVYVQVLPYLLFGKSIIATRLVSASITLFGALALGLLLKQVYKIKYHWAGVFLLLTTPAWFVHARTAFEYAEVASFYVIFLYFYGRYRDGNLKSLYAAIVFGALAFYTHGLGQILMSVTGMALFIVDFRYHIHPDRRKTFLLGLGLILILLLPFVRYYLAHSSESIEQVKRRGSYWMNNGLTSVQKLGEFFKQYLYGLNPMYWYFHNPVDIERHVMKGYGNGLLITLPFALVGFIQSVKNIRQFPYRIALIAFLAAPVPASVVAIGMPRMLWMSIPMALFATLGLSFCLEYVELHWKKVSARLPLATFILLTSLSSFMLRDALVHGPIWFDDYGLYGMQYGAKQIFAETILPELEKNPNLTFIVSPTWANGTDKFADFFIPINLLSHVTFGQPDSLAASPFNITANTRFILPFNEYNDLLKNPKFKDVTVYKTIPYPNNTPGFYVVSIQTVDNIDEILAAEKIRNRTPVEDTLAVNGQEIRVLHSPFGSGELVHVFDNNPDTLVRVLEANPFVFDIYPPTLINTHSVSIQTGSLLNFTVTISLYASDTSTPEIYSQTFKNLPPDPKVTLTFDKGPTRSSRIYVEIKDNLSGESSQIHVREIEFK
ncbi:MAG: hypothetical protein JNM55_20310 [Anaerolineales bacterium]|nr:hypothetical protein [Anaerolineales bacterium]